MPTWGQLLAELSETAGEHGHPLFDDVRRKYMAALHKKTNRNVILYASKWTQGQPLDAEVVFINDEDLQGLMEVMHGLSGSEVDLIIHSPGGRVEAAEAMLLYLRSRFSHVRVIIPSLAMSAATMLACGGNKIVMGKHSFIGPIDPQLIVPTQFGLQSVPAQAILDQYQQAQEECSDPTRFGAWIPILPQYGPALLAQCRNAMDLSRQLVRQWLKDYMFGADPARSSKAASIARKLCAHNRFKSHSRHISRADAQKMGLDVDNLEQDQELQDLVLSVFHATTHTFNGTPAVKIIENHRGRAFIKSQVPFALRPAVPPGPSPGPPKP